MSLNGRVLAFVAFLSLARSVVSVAPEDFYPLCVNRVDSMSSIEEKVLLDTDYYPNLSLLGPSAESELWLTLAIESGVEVDGMASEKWKDTDDLGVCEHEFTICTKLVDLKESWMITQYININRTGVSELLLNASFNTNIDFLCCSDSVDIRTFESNVMNETARNDLNEYNYSQITLESFAAGAYIQEVSNLPISLSNTTGLYLAFVVLPPGACIAITRIALFYYVCPKQEKDLLEFPEIIAPTTSSPQDILVDPVCVSNAVLTSIPGAKLACSVMGMWKSNEVACTCNEGYSYSNTSSTASCEACPPGTYKSVVANDNCLPCPENSISTVEAATICSCVEGYHRFPGDSAEYPCRGANFTAQQFCNEIRMNWSPVSNESTIDNYIISFSDTSQLHLLSVESQTSYNLTLDDEDCFKTYEITLLFESGFPEAHTNITIKCSPTNISVHEIFYNTSTDSGFVNASWTGDLVPGVDTFRVVSRNCFAMTIKGEGALFPSETSSTKQFDVASFGTFSVTSLNGVDYCFCKSMPLGNLVIIDVLLPGPSQDPSSQAVMVTFNLDVFNATLSYPASAEKCYISSSPQNDYVNVTCNNLALGVPYEVLVTGSVRLLKDEIYPLIFSVMFIATEETGSDPSLSDSGIIVQLVSGLIAGAFSLLVIIIIIVSSILCCVLKKHSATREKRQGFNMSEVASDFTLLSRKTSNVYETSFANMIQPPNPSSTQKMPFSRHESVIQAQGVRSRHLSQLGLKSLILSRQIRLLDSIGSGEFGMVYKGHLFRVGQDMPIMVAVKTLKGNFSGEEVDAFLSESIQMKQLSHPNVMSLLGVCLDAGPSPYLVMPFMSEGSLLNYLKKRRSTLVLTSNVDENDRSTACQTLLSMCLQIAKGMEHLASKKVIHRDLAARNCMIDDNGIIKVADFGLTKDVYEKMYFREDKKEGIKLPFKWMALESLQDGVFSEKTDVWSYGVTCWEVFSGGKIPYPGMSAMGLARCVAQGERMDIPDNAACSQEIFDMIMLCCWREQPEDRPTFSQLVADINTSLMEMADYVDIDAFQLPTKDC